MAQVRNREDDNVMQTPAKKPRIAEATSQEENVLSWSAVRIIRLTER